MIFRFSLIVLLTIGLASCHRQKQEGNSSVENKGHDHTAAEASLEEVKFQYTSYSDDFELFAEADPFVAGEKANILSHITYLSDFRPIEDGTINIILSVGGKEVRQTLDKPTRTGIYSFDIQPENTGKGALILQISNAKGMYEITVPEVTVYANDEEAHQAAESGGGTRTNAAGFTKEQSWKVNFATDYPKTEPFGQVIKTTALVQAAQGDEMVVTAKSAGIVQFTSQSLLEGQEVKSGQSLFSVAGNGLAENNISVRFAEAKSNYGKALADYERAEELAKDKIVSEKDLLSAKNLYENAKIVYDNLSRTTGASGQTISCPISGFVKQVYVKNGSYVEAGQALAVVSQNRTLTLTAEVPQRYAPLLGAVTSFNVVSPVDQTAYTSEQVKGKVLAYGKAANADNFLLPVTLQVDNSGQFFPGSFVDVYLKTITNTRALTVPVTALLEEQGLWFVWVQVNPELFEKREVRIAGTDGFSVEITGGISAGERIVTRGAMLIKLAQSTGALDAHAGHVH